MTTYTDYWLLLPQAIISISLICFIIIPLLTNEKKKK